MGNKKKQNNKQTKSQIITKNILMLLGNACSIFSLKSNEKSYVRRRKWSFVTNRGCNEIVVITCSYLRLLTPVGAVLFAPTNALLIPACIANISETEEHDHQRSGSRMVRVSNELGNLVSDNERWHTKVNSNAHLHREIAMKSELTLEPTQGRVGELLRGFVWSYIFNLEIRW